MTTPKEREDAVSEAEAFEQLCREHGIAGTAAARQCEVFWRAGARFTTPTSPTPAEAPAVQGEAAEQFERLDAENHALRQQVKALTQEAWTWNQALTAVTKKAGARITEEEARILNLAMRRYAPQEQKIRARALIESLTAEGGAPRKQMNPWFCKGCGQNAPVLTRDANGQNKCPACLATPLHAQVQGEAQVWRCFHCDEVFTTSDAAQEHFGKSEYQKPGCQIDVAEYRAMEERMRRCNEEDTDLHRTMYGMQSAHATALLREEEKGYARGLADAKKHPEALGLTHLPAQVQPAEQVGEPVGFLAASELSRLSSGHDARLRSAKFGPSALDGDVPIYLSPVARPPLTHEQIYKICAVEDRDAMMKNMAVYCARAVEAALASSAQQQPVSAEAISDPLDALRWGANVAETLLSIGRAIGFGRAQQILGEQWDVEHDVAPRGQMGVTIGKCIPPKMWAKRSQDAYRRGWNECAKAAANAALTPPQAPGGAA